MALSLDKLTGSELAVQPNALLREAREFRERMGYGGPIVGSAGEQPVRRVALEQRLAEVRALLEAPDRPRPDDAFGAYALLVHLSLAVDAKYLGPCDLSRSQDRAVCHPPEFFSAARSPAAVIGLLPELGFLIDPAAGLVEVAARTPSNPLPFEVAADDRFAPLKQYAWRDTRPLPASAIPSKRERMRQYFAFLGNAPATEDRLQSYALVNWLFGSLEGRHRAFPGATDAAHMFTNLPFIVHETAVVPGANLLFSTAHAMFYYADGSVDVFARDTRRDVKDGPRPLSIVLTERECRVRGRPQVDAGRGVRPVVPGYPQAAQA